MRTTNLVDDPCLSDMHGLPSYLIRAGAGSGPGGGGPLAATVELEVTESMVMRDSPTVSKVVGDLRVLGIDLAMDDFGTGHSSLAQLRRLPLHRLKIDILVVRDIGRDPAAEAIIRAIIAMAGSLGLQTAAEGPEREEQAAFLRDAGCDIGQGYLFGHPMPADALRAAWAKG